MTIEKEEKCLLVFDKALKRLIASTILFAFAFFFLNNAPFSNFAFYLLCFLIYLVLSLAAGFYMYRVWSIAVVEIQSIELSEHEEAFYVVTLSMVYLLSLIMAVTALYGQLPSVDT